ncbi:MAG TPA: glycosyltransferase family 2 protein [Candidatus Limnocylindria bacterium]|nr:glycosyltransferase family 2 protein [Candidatus Limnocylindria bacterium]
MDRLPALSFFFPAYNEEESVIPLVEEALATLPRFADDFEVIVIDDGSRDRTGELADGMAARHHGRVRVVHHRPNRGYGGAVRSGLVSARKPFVFFTDGDRQFRLEDLGLLVDAIEGVDAVVGYRRVRRDPFRRLAIAWVYKQVIRVLFGTYFRDVDCAYKLFRREAFERVPLSKILSNGAFFSAELLLSLRAAGVRIAQVPVPHYPRTAGRAAGAAPRVVLRTIRDLLALRVRLWRRR